MTGDLTIFGQKWVIFSAILVKNGSKNDPFLAKNGVKNEPFLATLGNS